MRFITGPAAVKEDDTEFYFPINFQLKKSLMLADNRILIACPYTDNNHIFLLLNDLARKGVKVIVLTRMINNGYSKAEHLLELKKMAGVFS